MPDKKGVEFVTLTRRKDFVRLNAGARKKVTTTHIIQTAATPGDEQPFVRVGITVTRRLGGAVVRNRIKRRLRACIRELVPQHARAGQDYVIIARKEAHMCDYAVLLRDMRYALKKLSEDQKTEEKQL